MHGSRPVPSDALPGVLGAGMTLECVAIVPFECGAFRSRVAQSFRWRVAPSRPPNVIPAQAGTQYTGQQ